MAELTHTHSLSHKSTKPISSLTKQTGSIKTDNPTNSKRQGDGGQGTILKNHIGAHKKTCPESFSQTELKQAFSCPV